MNVEPNRFQSAPELPDPVKISITTEDRSLRELLNDLKGDLTGLYRDRRYYEEDYLVRSILGRKVITVLEPQLIDHVLLKNPGNYQRGTLQKSTVQPWAGDGILASEGETWKQQRKLSEPWFFRHNLDRFGGPVKDAAFRTAEEWSIAAKSGQTLDLETSLVGFSTRVIARSLFSSDIESQFDELRDILHRVQQRMARVGFLDLIGLGHHLRRLPRGEAHRLNTHLHAIFDRIIADRLNGRVRRDDFLQTMVDAERTNDTPGLSRKQIYDTAISYFLGAPESVGYSLVWTLYLLSLHPEIQEKAAEEAKAFNLDKGDMKSLEALEYCWAVLQEAMRLYPPVHSFTREAIGRDRFNGLDIPKRSLLFFPVYTIHRHRKLWTNPDTFDPERFSKSRRQADDHVRFLAFSAGPRFCLGRSLAEMETKIALAALLSRFRIEPDYDRPVRDMEAFVTLRPKGGCHVRIFERRA